MEHPFVALLRDLGRGMVGALLLGVPLMYTMEAWWLGWTLPASVLLGYLMVGLTIVFFATRTIGFREHERHLTPGLRQLVPEFMVLVFESAVAAYGGLLLLGVIEFGDAPGTMVRAGVVQMVPLALGAAVANRALRAAPAEEGEEVITGFREEMGVFTAGAIFLSLAPAPTEEMALIAAHAGWTRLALVMVASFGLAYLTLYLLEFRGHRGRLARLETTPLRLGETCVAYGLALALSTLLLAGFGNLTGSGFDVALQKVIVLALPATLGGTAAQVVF